MYCKHYRKNVFIRDQFKTNFWNSICFGMVGRYHTSKYLSQTFICIYLQCRYSVSPILTGLKFIWILMLIFCLNRNPDQGILFWGVHKLFKFKLFPNFVKISWNQISNVKSNLLYIFRKTERGNWKKKFLNCVHLLLLDPDPFIVYWSVFIRIWIRI